MLFKNYSFYTAYYKCEQIISIFPFQMDWKNKKNKNMIWIGKSLYDGTSVRIRVISMDKWVKRKFFMKKDTW